MYLFQNCLKEIEVGIDFGGQKALLGWLEALLGDFEVFGKNLETTFYFLQKMKKVYQGKALLWSFWVKVVAVMH